MRALRAPREISFSACQPQLPGMAGQLHLISIKNLPSRPIRGGGYCRYGRLNAEDAEAAEVRREEIKICYSGYDNDR